MRVLQASEVRLLPSAADAVAITPGTMYMFNPNSALPNAVCCCRQLSVRPVRPGLMWHDLAKLGLPL